jgi:aryl-alcohol dehydrogenase-like predicted oxidoreductase
MNSRRLGESDLVVSAFCLGAMPFGSKVTGAAVDELADCYRDAGGNFFDTAHCYCFWTPGGAGCSERELGRYIKSRGCRDEVVIATKGAHPPMDGYRDDEDYMTAGRIAADIDDSLSRLAVDTIDLYWLHRDDPRVEAGAIVEMLNGEVKRGRIRAFGGSNWTSQRFDEANRYARERGLDGFAASQPRWSLLAYEPQTEEERLQPAAVVHVQDEDRRWHEASQMAVIPYGPTGNGFFATHGERPERRGTPANLERLRRVMSLADGLGATANQVALAWLLCQPFPVIPILGTSKVDHLRDALGAEGIDLTPEQRDSLDRG